MVIRVPTITRITVSMARLLKGCGLVFVSDDFDGVAEAFDMVNVSRRERGLSHHRGESLAELTGWIDRLVAVYGLYLDLDFHAPLFVKLTLMDLTPLEARLESLTEGTA